MTDTPRPIDDPGRFMSAAIDWRRVFTMLLYGAPCAFAIGYAGQRVLESGVAELRAQLTSDRAFYLDQIAKGDQANAQQLRREVDQVRDDVRDLRREVGDLQRARAKP